MAASGSMTPPAKGIATIKTIPSSGSTRRRAILGGAQMLWTEEAIEILKRLALEGRSASVIAEALGAPSRNAVIGKANRIGIKLGGGGRASAPGEPCAPAYRAPSGLAADARRLPGRRGEPAAPRGWAFADAKVGEMRRVRLEDMRELACRWPLGDPGSGDFAYCGLTPAAGRSYCPGHCRLAYRPPNEGPRRTGHDPRQRVGNSWRAA